MTGYRKKGKHRFEENGKINLFLLAVNIKSIAFRSNSSRRLFTFIPTHEDAECDTVISMALSGPGYKSLDAQYRVINFPPKRNLFSLLDTHA